MMAYEKKKEKKGRQVSKLGELREDQHEMTPSFFQGMDERVPWTQEPVQKAGIATGTVKTQNHFSLLLLLSNSCGATL